MAITSISQTRFSPTSIRVDVTSDDSDPVYYWYRDGFLVHTDVIPYHTFELAPNEAARIEVFDDSGSTPEDGYPGRVRIYWDAQDDAVSYDVYQENKSISGSSAELVFSVQDNGDQYFEFETDHLNDYNQYEWTVYAKNSAGNSSVARTLTTTIYRKPTAPSGTYSYDDGTGVLTFTPD